MFSRLLITLCSALLACFGAAASAQMSTVATTGHADTRLVAERLSAAPGETITLAIVQELDHHWHVYWRNPGDSGLPLDLAWRLPEGFEAGSIAYPLPKKLPLGPLTNYGHEGEPVFLVELSIPDTATPGSSVPVVVEAAWLICADICVPESATLRMVLPITAAPGAPTPRFAGLIEEARTALPQPATFNVSYYDDARGPVLAIDDGPDGDYEFFPYAPSLTEPSAETYRAEANGRRLMGFRSGFAYQAKRPERLSGVLVIVENGARRGYQVAAPFAGSADGLPTLGPLAISEGRAPSAARSTAAPVLLVTLGLAFLGGVVLNAMPCVFPIVFLKAAGFAAVAREERGTIRRHGLLYTAGVLAAFMALAGVLIGLRGAGEMLGWGFHLQSPVAVGVFALVIFLVGLNLAGVFEFGSAVQGFGGGLAARGGGVGAFFTGLLAVAVAAPCIGPFLGGAVGAALSQPAIIGLLIFVMIGFGLALPYLLISFFPAVVRMLPKPGPWMVTLRQLFAFAMFATLVWLVWVISAQTGSAGVLRLGTALVIAALAAWLFGKSQRGEGGTVSRALAATALILAVVPVAQLTAAPASVVRSNPGELASVAYDEEVLATLRAEGTPVFVDFTAAWCISCQFNKRTVLNTGRVVQAFEDAGAVYMVADWTVRDPVITAALERYGRAGVPLYLYFAPGAAEAQILPQLLTTDRVRGLFETNEGEENST